MLYNKLYEYRKIKIIDKIIKDYLLYRNSVTMYAKRRMFSAKKKEPEGTPIIKQVLPPEKEKRGTDDLFVLLFTRLALQGIVCYTFSIYYRVVI